VDVRVVVGELVVDGVVCWHATVPTCQRIIYNGVDDTRYVRK
jgi:hypothetical protein